KESATANPLYPGVAPGELVCTAPWSASVLNLLDVERRGGKAYLPGAAASLGNRADAAARLQADLAAGDLVRVEDRDLARYLEEHGRLRRLGDGYAIGEETYARARAALIAQAESAGPATL